MELSFRRVGKPLRKGKSVVVEGESFIPVIHIVNKHQQKAVEEVGLTNLSVGDRVICYVDGCLQIREIRRIKRQNFLPRFRVGIKSDKRQWIGKTKILGVRE